jgi:hypothetical protein
MKQPKGRIIQDNEMAVMGRICDLLATLTPERRHRVHEYIGGRLDDLPVIAQVERPEPVPMFPDAETRSRQRQGGAA